MFPKTIPGSKVKIKGYVSEDRRQIREKILKSSLVTRGQLWFILCVLQTSREVAKKQNRDDWRHQINDWIDRLGAMYNALLYLQVNVYEQGLNNDLMKLKDLQKEMQNVNAIRTDRLFLKCLFEMPDALNAPVNTIEEEMGMLEKENAGNREIKFSIDIDPWL